MLFQFTDVNMAGYKPVKGPRTSPHWTMSGGTLWVGWGGGWESKGCVPAGSPREGCLEEGPSPTWRSHGRKKNSNGNSIRQRELWRWCPGSSGSVGALQEIQEFLCVLTGDGRHRGREREETKAAWRLGSWDQIPRTGWWPPPFSLQLRSRTRL